MVLVLFDLLPYLYALLLYSVDVFFDGSYPLLFLRQVYFQLLYLQIGVPFVGVFYLVKLLVFL